MITAAREMVARFAGAWPRWRDPYQPHPAEHDARVEAADANAQLVALLADLVEAEAARPKPVAARPEPDDAAPPMTDPGQGDKGPAGFIPPHLDREGPFGHLPSCQVRPEHDPSIRNPWKAAWARLTDEEQA